MLVWVLLGLVLGPCWGIVQRSHSRVGACTCELKGMFVGVCAMLV